MAGKRTDSLMKVIMRKSWRALWVSFPFYSERERQRRDDDLNHFLFLRLSQSQKAYYHHTVDRQKSLKLQKLRIKPEVSLFPPPPTGPPCTKNSEMDIVWLKRDLRLADHGPFAEVKKSDRPLLIIYNYEPDQLSEHSVHCSHVAFINEGLIDLDRKLSESHASSTASPESSDYTFNVITVCHSGIVYTLNLIREQTKDKGGIHRILTHEETGHLKSFSRDKAVRRWCRAHSIQIIEYNQTGVTRCLSSRDDFSKKFKAFIQKQLWEKPSQEQIRNMRERLVDGLDLYKRCKHPLYPQRGEVSEIPVEHREDRPERQKGGETEGLSILESFLCNRGRHYASGISSPNTSWTTGGRISPYLTWGNLSTRYVIHMLQKKQEELRQRKKSKLLSPVDGPWLRSLSAFSSRIHWRSHFIQKLESQPLMEKRDLCSAYQQLRRQADDWNEEYYQAWSTGTTGFPFVDACMRCLLRHGWLNFRMRAMLVSFATYNLWLDWKRIAPHLARVFLDYEPGIHYPQLQMQAGTTGINAMRVYNVTKQGKDQDPYGIFIKKYVSELENVPIEYIHEPCKMSLSQQEKFCIVIGKKNDTSDSRDVGIGAQRRISFQMKNTKREGSEYRFYPMPIVNEKESAKKAKEKVANIRKQGSTKRLAEQVYIKHGSRSSRNGNMDGAKPKALSSTVKRVKLDASMEPGQTSIKNMFQRKHFASSPGTTKRSQTSSPGEKVTEAKEVEDLLEINQKSVKPSTAMSRQKDSKKRVSEADVAACGKLSKIGTIKTTLSGGDNATDRSRKKSWNCSACTYLNEKPYALACLICGTERN